MQSILIVNDEPETRALLKSHLTKEGYAISEAETGEIALEKIKNELPDVVLLEMLLPGMTGFQFCQQLLNTPQSDLVYIIMLTVLAKNDLKLRNLDKGPDAYVTKPIDPPTLLERIRVGLEIVKKKQDAVLDPLTKLYHKNFFNAYLAQEVSKAQRYQQQLALIMGAFDHFKHINETYGQVVSDAALAELGKILREHCRQSDLPVRWEVGEFAILLPETDFMGGMLMAERLCQVTAARQFADLDHLTASFGVAILTTNRQEFLERAKSGLAEAQRSGGNKVVFINK